MSKTRMAEAARQTELEIHASWIVSLHALADQHDLRNSDERADFRTSVERLTTYTRTEYLRRLATHLGKPVKGNCSKYEAMRAVATAVIVAQRAKAGDAFAKRSKTDSEDRDS